MKTIKLFFAIVLLSIISWTASATHTHLYLEDVSTDPSFYYCSAEYDSLIIHRPENGNTNRQWETPGMIEINNQDSVIMLSSDPMGHWLFYSTETWFVDFFVYFTSPINQPTCMAEPISKCMLNFSQLLDAENEGPGTTYLWSTGATTRTITVHTPGTYAVTITNACGEGIYSVDIVYDNPNRPDLGPDTEFCANEGYELFPGSADVNTYLWSTGSIDPSITVSESGEYWVYVVDANGCSGRDTVTLTALPTYNIEMCHVSFDTLTNKNQVTWFVDPMEENIMEVVVYVKNEWGEWAAMETTDYQNGQMVDWNSNPQADYNEYRVAALSECGSGEMSQVHRSIWLSTFASELQWQNYYGTFVPDYYVVYARTTSGALQVMGNVPSCTGSGCINHYAITANPDIVKYFVMFEHDCSSNKSTTGWVMSNDIDASVGIATASLPEISLYPNPTTDKLTMSIQADQASIFTLLGQELLSETSTSVLDVSTLPTGIYLLQVIVGNEIIKKQFVKQ